MAVTSPSKSHNQAEQYTKGGANQFHTEVGQNVLTHLIINHLAFICIGKQNSSTLCNDLEQTYSGSQGKSFWL